MLKYENCLLHHSEGEYVSVEFYKQELEEAQAVIKEAKELISSTGYMEHDGNRCFSGNEWPWIDRGLNCLKKYLDKHGLGKRKQ